MPTDATALPQSGTFTPPGTSPPPDSAAPPPAPRPDQGPSAAPPQAAPPRGAPTPYGGPREPYLPLVRNRPMSQMGTDDWVTAGLRKYPGVPQGPWVPQPQDVNQLTHQISAGLGRIGSGIVGPMALGLGSYRAAYLKAFLQGRQVAMQMAKEQHDMIAVRLEEQLGKEQTAIAEILAYYKDKPQRAEEMWTRLREATYGTDDKVLQQAINEKNGAGLERVMQARDGYHQSLAKLNEMRTKTAADLARTEAERQKAEDAAALRKQRADTLTSLGINPGALPAITPPPDASTTPPGAPEEPAGATETPSGASPAPGATEPEDEGLPAPALLGPRGEAPQAPGRQALGQPPVAAGEQPAPTLGIPQSAEADPENAPPYQVAGPAMPPPSQPQQLAQQAAPQTAPSLPAAQPPASNNAQIREWAHQVLLGQKPDLGSDKVLAGIIRPYVDREAIAMRTRLNAIANDSRYDALPADVRQDAVLAAVRGVDPEFARDAQNLIFGGRVPTGREAVKPGFQLTFALARKADPSFDINTVNTRSSVMRSFASGQDARTLTSMATSEHHLDALREAAAALSGTQISSSGDYPNIATQWWAQHFGIGGSMRKELGPESGDRIRAYNTVLDMVAPEIARAVKGAAPTLREIEDMKGQLGAGVPTRSLVNNIDKQRGLIRDRLGELKRRYLEGVGNNPKLGIERLFTVQSSQGEFGQNSAAPEGTVQPPPIPMPPGYNYAAALGRLGTAGGSGPAANVPIPVPDEYRSLPDGTVKYRGSQGYVKRGNQMVPQ